jgi:hypothetical protein
METPLPTSERILYRRIAQQLGDAIDAGLYPHGQRLPVEQTLARELKISRTTLRLALNELASKGVVERKANHSGVFVCSPRPKAGRLHVLGVGPFVRESVFNAVVLMQAERAARRVPWQLSMHFEEQLADLRARMLEIDADPAAVGGLLVGPCTTAQAADAVVGLRLPWVRIGDFRDTRRTAPVMHQVLNDPYALYLRAAERLIAAGCRRPALFVFTASLVWSNDAINGLRCACETAGIPLRDQEVIDLEALRLGRPRTRAENARSNTAAVRRVFDAWRENGRWPDGILLPGADFGSFDDAERQDALAARKLADVQIALPGFRELLDMVPRQFPVHRTTLVLESMADQLDLAIQILQEHAKQPLAPRREYMRQITVEP